MKKRILSALLICAAPVVLTAQVKYTLKGKVGNLGNPAKIYLRYPVDGNMKTVDSAILQNGQFSFTGKLVEPVRAFLQLNHQSVQLAGGRNFDALAVYLENGTINITSDDSVKNATITGSRLNDDYKRLEQALKPLNEKSMKLRAEYNSYTAEQKKDKALMADLEKKSDALTAERRSAYKKFIIENPSSFVNMDIIPLAVDYAPAYEEIAFVFASLSKELKNSAAGKKMAAKIERIKALSVGAMAPDFAQNDTSGLPVKLSSFRGKYVLVDFWASWCGPCRAENPNVVKSFNKYKDKNFTVLGVSLDRSDGKEKWLKAIADDQLFWTQVSDLAFWNNAVAKLYEVQAIPQNYLIDPAGKIVGRNLHGEELDKKLSELLN